MDLLSTSTVSLVSGTFLVNFRLIREPFLLFLAEWIYFSLFVTQLAMPTPFNVTNMDQKKPNRWAPLLNYWKVWFITVFSSPYFFEHMIQFKNWTLKGFNSLILYSSNWNFSSNWGLSVFSVKKRASLLTLRGVLLLLRVDDEVDAPCLLGGGWPCSTIASTNRCSYRISRSLSPNIS